MLFQRCNETGHVGVDFGLTESEKPLKEPLNESTLIEAIEAYTQQHGKMPTALCGTFAQIYPVMRFCNFSTFREKEGFFTPFGMVSLHLDTKAVGWYLAGDE